MKKKIIVTATLITSLFITIVCILLGVYLLAVNDYGININHEHLFPDFQITRLDDNTFSTSQFNTDIYSKFRDNSKITIQNNSNYDISLNISYPNFKSGVKYNNLRLYRNIGAPVTQTSPTSFTINSIPDNYDIYYINEQIISTTQDLFMGLDLDYNCDGTCGKGYQSDNYNSKTVTVKKGETYEVKLS